MSAAPASIQYAHIDHDEQGIPFIAGSTMKVVELVMAQQAHGWSPEELYFQHPELSLGEIHSALATTGITGLHSIRISSAGRAWSTRFAERSDPSL